MKIITVTGGKGGIGKSYISINLAFMLHQEFRKRVLLVDTDVENPCTFTFFKTKTVSEENIEVFQPKFLEKLCKLCGVCSTYCPTHAIVIIPGKKLIYVETLCEGCGLCLHICPNKAIIESKKVIGKIYFMNSEYEGLDLLVGELLPGSRHHHEVMERVMEALEKYSSNYDYVVIDTPPGTGKGILLSVKKADTVVAVTEPTPLGFHDLKKLFEMLLTMKKKIITVINKFNLPYGICNEIEKFLIEKDIDYVKIPYSSEIMKAYMMSKPLSKIIKDDNLIKIFEELIQKIY